MGVFHLKTPISVDESEEDIVFPKGSLEFVVDYNAPADDLLTTEIALSCGKLKALAFADLETFIINGKQMMNISKPFIIDRIGILERNYKGEISFTPISYPSGNTQKGKKYEPTVEEVRFDDNYLLKFRQFKTQYKKLLTSAAGVLVLILFFWFGYRFFRNPSLDIAVPTAAATTSFVDSEKPIREVVQPEAVISSVDSFFIVVEKATKKRADIRFADLKKWGHNVQIKTEDSINYSLRLPINAPLSDSTIHRDSLARFFGRRVWVERN